MKASEDLIKLLIISDQNTQMNHLLSRLRSAGVLLRAEGLDSKSKLQQKFNSEPWDLIVCFESAHIPVEDVLKRIKQLDLDIPLLFITAANSTKDPATMVKLGAHDVIPEIEERRILFSVEREAASHQLKRRNIELELSLKELEKRHQLLLNNSNDAFSYIHEGLHIYSNQSYQRLVSLPNDETLHGSQITDLVSELDVSRLKKLLNNNIQIEAKINLQIKPFEGDPFDVEMVFSPVEYAGQSCLQLSIKPPVSNSKYTSEIDKFSNQDLLTSLDNQPHFYRRIEAAIREAIKNSVYSSLLIIQIDKFLDITSVIGKPNANMVVSDVSQFLQDSIKKPFAAARLSEHEFGIILFDGDPEEALELSSFITTRINNHITATALPSFELSCSVGVATINGNALDADDLISKARGNINSTMEIPDNSKNYTICDSKQPNSDDMLNYLEIALKEKKFKLLFQAIVNIKGDGTENYEILTRMLDLQGNEIPPFDFIPLANLNGLGEKIDRLIIEMAINLLKNAPPPLPRLIINLTSNSLVSKTLLPWFSDLLRRSRLPSDLLLFQISEIDLYNNIESTLAFCQQLEELNIKKSITHFGCAVEPFEHLLNINPEYVKLDTSIINDILDNTIQKELARSLIGKLHRLKCLVVTPQVEVMESLPLLWEIGTDFAQGYYLQKPSQEMNYEFTQEQEITLDAVQIQ